MPYLIINESGKQYRNEYFPDFKSFLPGNDGYLNLVNVKLLTPNGNINRFKHLAVFFDQIIAVSIGNINFD